MKCIDEFFDKYPTFPRIGTMCPIDYWKDKYNKKVTDAVKNGNEEDFGIKDGEIIDEDKFMLKCCEVLNIDPIGLYLLEL